MAPMMAQLQKERTKSGHRERLRERFLAGYPEGTSDEALLELLLTYAIPRIDVQPIAKALLRQFGDLPSVLAAGRDALTAVKGISESSATLLKLVWILKRKLTASDLSDSAANIEFHVPGFVQPTETRAESLPGASIVSRFEKPEVRVFVTDLADAALKLVPEAARFSDIEEYRKFLVGKLAYNSVSTRKRNAGYLINRLFPGHYLHPDLTAFAAAAGETGLGDVLFYLTARSERILQLVAEKVVWPALPVGGVSRSKVRDFVKGHLKSDDPAKRTTIAVAQCYAKFGIASVTKTKIAASIRTGTLASFAYLLHLEFPEPGMHTFEKLLDGPLHKWLLWDRQWMVEQLYLCRHTGLLAKVSEIDSMRQFTTRYSLAEAITRIVNLIGRETP